jgi:phosphopantetheine--protein transferase-like protein
MTPEIHHWEKVHALDSAFPIDLEMWLIHPCPSTVRVSDLVKERFKQEPSRYISKDTYGKPYFDPPNGITFSGAHCSQAALLGVAKNRVIGVDIEKVDARRFKEKIVKTYFTKDENDLLASLTFNLRVQKFFRLWASKEAVIKATGLGPALNLEHIQITDTGQPRVEIFDAQTQIFEPSQLELCELELTTDYVGFVASASMNRI